MSKFRKFGLPRLLDRTSPGQPKPKVEGSDGIPRFDFNKLVIKDRIGHGAFGDVFTADYQAPGKDSKETVVIKKMINVMDAEEKKLFLKEVALLSGLNHPNVVKFMSVCLSLCPFLFQFVWPRRTCEYTVRFSDKNRRV